MAPRHSSLHFSQYSGRSQGLGHRVQRLLPVSEVMTTTVPSTLLRTGGTE